MKKPFTFLRLTSIFALFVVPSLLLANGEPNNNPLNSNPDSLAMLLGHCNPITVVTVNCVTKTIEVQAFIRWLFSGALDPYVATWSTGEVAHKITVVPPGTWSWDASGTSCEPNHWQNEYSEPGSFFQGTLDILGQTLCPNGFVDLTVVPPDNIYSFTNYSWNPANPNGGLSPYEVTQPGLYQLTVTDQLGCNFTDQINVPQTPPVVPTLSGPLSMSPAGDTGVVTVNQAWSAYLWSDGQTTNSITVTQPGIYEVTVTNQFGCTGVGFFGIQQHIPLPWTVTPTSRNHTIIIPDSLKFDALGGILQIGDQIGVFYDSSATGILKCGGYGVWSGLTLVFPAYGNDAAPMPQNGFNTGEVFKIKIWRSSSGEVSDATALYAPVGWLAGLVTHTNAFADDGVSMITSITGITHAITLNIGWNMISSYVIPAQPDMLNVFGPIASSVDIVKDGDGKGCIPAIPINVIGDWNLLKGYQVRANQKDTLLVKGQKAVPAENPIPIKTGWQIIGYLRDSPMNIDTVFKSIKSQINLIKNNDGKIYSPQFGINTIGNMIPGQGYKVNAISNVTLSYRPNFTGSPVDERAEKTIESDMPHFVLDSNLNTGNNAIIILTDSIAKSVIAFGDEIGVFTPAGVLCGTAIYKKENLAITVWEDDASTNNIVEGMKNGEAYKFKVWDISEQKECQATTTFLSGINAYTRDAIEVIQTLMLSVPTYSTITAVACDSYVLNNQTYTSSGTYTQILTNAAGCDSTITLHLTINPDPNVTVDNQTICSGQMATLTANGAENYLWNTGATTNSITVSPNATTIYTVTGATAGCTASVESTLTVHPLPIIDLGANISLPTGDTAVLDATCACQSYQWSTGETTSTIKVHSIATYTVTVSTAAGCTASDNIVIMTTSTNDPHDGYSITISPNPTDDLLFITCHGASTSAVQIIDNLGKVIFKENTFVPDGAARTLSLKKIPSGSYYVRIVGDGFARTFSIIKH